SWSLLWLCIPFDATARIRLKVLGSHHGDDLPMKQILQRLDNGQTYLLDVPVPAASGVRLVIRSRASVISAGTERMLVEFGRGSLIDKARAQPDKVRDVLAKVRTDGLLSTFEAVQGKLATPIPLGYCNAGVI